MKNHEIKQAVEAHAEKHLPKAIKEEAEYRARSMVREAMYDEPESKKEAATEDESKEADHTGGVTNIPSHDPRIGGGC